MILVLGGGWCGSRLCARDPSKFITTSRTEENVQKLVSLGLNAVCFDLRKQETWCNLPPKDTIKAVIITFEVLSPDLVQWGVFFDQIVPADCPVVCYGTSSAFSTSPVVDETRPLTGISIVGNSLSDRVNGEEWMLGKGAIVLHLVGICSDPDTNAVYPGVGSPRTIQSFMSAGYIKDGYRLVNFVHINDIYQISMILIDKVINQGPNVDIRGQRLLVSCGAFRIQEFGKSLGSEPLPCIEPQGMFIERNKIISVKKLLAILPEDYKWTLPLKGVEPISRGLPTAKLQGVAFDHQWELLKQMFCGKWQGKSRWYKKSKEMDHDDYIAAMNGLVLPAPDSTGDCHFNVFCIDADTIIWRGTGSHSSPDGAAEKTAAFSKHSLYFASRRVFSFPSGLGGFVSEEITNDKDLSVEVNFYYKRSRSMIVAIYSYNATAGHHRLSAVVTTPFRCGHGFEIPLKPSQHEVRGDLNRLIQSLQGRQCQKQYIMSNNLKLTTCENLFHYPTDSIELFSSSKHDRVVQLFDDDIVCSIPADVYPGSGCELVFGCFHSDTYAQFVTIGYDEKGKVQKYSGEKWEL